MLDFKAILVEVNLVQGFAQNNRLELETGHLWGGPFAVKKMHFLVHKVVGNLSLSEPFHFFFFWSSKTL